MRALLRILTEIGAQDRRVLAMRMGVTDRRMRAAIETARLRGYLVLTLDGLYRLADTLEDFERWVTREQESRLRTFGQQLHAMRQTAAVRWPPQMKLFEREAAMT